jgi:hypothetical protein
MRKRAEAEAAVLLRDDHPEEALVLDELPHVLRQVLQLVRDPPVVAHRAQLLDRAVEERLLLGREARRGHREQLVPVRPAGEEVRVPPHRAGVDRLLLGLGHVREDAAVDGEDMVGDRDSPDQGHVQHRRDDHEGAPGDRVEGEIREARGGGERPDDERRAEIAEHEEGGDAGEHEGGDGHGVFPRRLCGCCS